MPINIILARPTTHREMLCQYDGTYHPGPTRLPGTMNEIFDVLEPVFGVPDSCKLAAIAKGDSEKHICMGVFPPVSESSAACSIVSIGSNNEYDYEMDIIDRMPCEIHVFDCTVDNPTPPEKLAKSPRFFFYKLCIAAQDDKEKRLGTWQSIALLASHNATRPILSLKIDVEGWEFEVLKQVGAPEMVRLQLVPMQIACEIHQLSFIRYNIPQYSRLNSRSPLCSVSYKQIRDLVVETMGSEGYLLADRNDNPFCATCTEVVLLHVHMYGLNKPFDFRPADSAIVQSLSSPPSIDMSTHLANQLNIPSLLQKHHHGFRSHTRNAATQTEDTTSILALYREVEVDLHKCSSFLPQHVLCAQFPMKDVLIEAVKRYGQRHQIHATHSPLSPSRSEHEYTLAVHVRLGDKNEFDPTFVETLENLLHQTPSLKSVVIQGSADADHHGSGNKNPWASACSLETSWRSLQKRLGSDKVLYHVPQSPDDDLYLLSRSKHLLVHAGVYSALLAIVSTGTVYIPERMVSEYYSLEFVKMLPSQTIVLAHNGTAYPISRFLQTHLV
ncbi:hypothetical protein EON65_33015 [archaeon]|nr:MAG: hypothetical protein EON65_33015 [archaeon]